MRLYLSLLISSSLLICCSGDKEGSECADLETYIESNDYTENWELILIASDRYCDTCLELAISQIITKEKRFTKIILSGSNYPKSIKNILEHAPSNVTVEFDKKRRAEKYFALAKPLLFLIIENECVESIYLTTEKVEAYYD